MGTPVRLDHLSYACGIESFPSTVSRLGALLGAPFADGGLHPRYGTRNAVLPMAGGTYIEVVAPLDHPSTDSAPFGQAVKRRAARGGGWLGWAVAVDDLSPFEKRLGRPSGEGRRRRPDGVLLEWRQIGLLELTEDPQIPFLIEWCCLESDHPSAGADGTLAVDRLEISGERAAVLQWLGAPDDGVLPEVDVEWLGPGDAFDETGLVAVGFRTARGAVRID
jgi:hypothetical protein